MAELYKLSLNDMRDPQIEMTTDVCYGTLEELKAFVEEESVERYSDPGLSHPWYKSFRRGGPLEWFNKPFWNPYVKMHSLQEIKNLRI